MRKLRISPTLQIGLGRPGARCSLTAMFCLTTGSGGKSSGQWKSIPGINIQIDSAERTTARKVQQSLGAALSESTGIASTHGQAMCFVFTANTTMSCLETSKSFMRFCKAGAHQLHGCWRWFSSQMVMNKCIQMWHGPAWTLTLKHFPGVEDPKYWHDLQKWSKPFSFNPTLYDYYYCHYFYCCSYHKNGRW